MRRKGLGFFVFSILVFFLFSIPSVEGQFSSERLGDLVISSIFATPSNPDTDDLVSLEIVVKNSGVSDIGSSTLQILIEKDGNIFVNEQIGVPDLSAGQSKAFVIQFSLNAEGDYIITTTVDVFDQVSEFVEDNNVDQSAIRVTQANIPQTPQLEIQDIAIIETQSGPRITEIETTKDYFVASQIKNHGSQAQDYITWIVVGDWEDKVGESAWGFFRIEADALRFDGLPFYVEPYMPAGPSIITLYLVSTEYHDIANSNPESLDTLEEKKEYVTNNYLAKATMPVNVISSVPVCDPGTELVNGVCQSIPEPEPLLEFSLLGGPDGPPVLSWGDSFRVRVQVSPFNQNMPPTVTITNPSGLAIFSSQLEQTSFVEGDIAVFTPTIQTGGPLWESPGNYRIETLWQGQIEFRNFEYPGKPASPHEEPTDALIPEHLRTPIGWWVDGLTPDSEFISAIQWLIENGIMIIPETEISQTSGSQVIPEHLRTPIGWWVDGLTPDSEFISAIQWLITNGIMQIDTSNGGSPTPEPEDPTSSKIIVYNDSVWNVVSFDIEGVGELFTQAPMMIPAGGSNDVIGLSPGNHSFVALLGYWDEYSQRQHFYYFEEILTQQDGVIGEFHIPAITAKEILTKFEPSGLWVGEYNCYDCDTLVNYSSFRFYSDGTWELFDNGTNSSSGNYFQVSRTQASTVFSIGDFQGTIVSESQGAASFKMNNGPTDWPIIEYYYVEP